MILIKNVRAFSHDTHVYEIKYIISIYIFHLHDIK